MICPSCGKELPRGAAECPGCGARQSHRPPPGFAPFENGRMFYKNEMAVNSQTGASYAVTTWFDPNTGQLTRVQQPGTQTAGIRQAPPPAKKRRLLPVAAAIALLLGLCTGVLYSYAVESGSLPRPPFIIAPETGGEGEEFARQGLNPPERRPY